MTHSWKYYEAAKEIAERLHQMGLISTLHKDKIRGVIQIILEDKYSEEGIIDEIKELLRNAPIPPEEIPDAIMKIIVDGEKDW